MYNIIEVANCHGGNIDYMLDLIKEFEHFNKKNNFGIKFQPFKYDEIATKEYFDYQTYKKFFFNKEQWGKIINKAYKTKDIWLDIFDNYSLKIVEDNINKIYGLKLQTSILDNNIIFNKLKTINLSNINFIINIAGRNIENIDILIKKYNKLNVKKLILEVGFQAYPTKLINSGLSKVNILKNKYKNDIIFADHIDGKSKDSIILPLIAGMYGVNYIEKHVMHSKLETKYDYYSSIKIDKYENFIKEQKKYLDLLNTNFINKAEKEYLKKTYQIPIFNKDKEKNNLIDINNDFIYKRSNEKGLDINNIKKLIKEHYIVNTKKDKGTILKKEDLRKANIGAIIACRLKSTRLKRKALLKVGKLTSIELCIKNTLKLKNINNTFLATSIIEEDGELKDYTYHDSVIFRRGDPEDVITRYIDIINEFKLDIIVRITGDNPYISHEIFDILLESHFKSGADYTVGNNATIGTNFEIINANSLKFIKNYFGNASHSEYMTFYFQNNPNIFKLNFVDLPNNLIRNYRLTLDYQEDLDMYNQIEKHFAENNIQFNLFELYNFLDNNKKIRDINGNISQKYNTDEKLIEILKKETKIII